MDRLSMIPAMIPSAVGATLVVARFCAPREWGDHKGRPIGVRLTNGSRADSLPPCGGGTGWGGRAMGHGGVTRLDPHPRRAPLALPTRGRGGVRGDVEPNLAPMGATLVVARFCTPRERGDH